MMRAVIDAVSSGVPALLVEIRRLGRTLKQRAVDVLVFFDRPGTSNGPTEAINGRLEHLRGSALDLAVSTYRRNTGDVMEAISVGNTAAGDRPSRTFRGLLLSSSSTARR